MLNVPTPQTFILHKLVIYHERKDIKKEKDMITIANLFEHLRQSPVHMDLLRDTYERLSRSQKSKVAKTCTITGFALEIA